MLISKAREQEKEIRQNLLKTMAVCLRMYEKTKDPYWKDAMTFYGTESKRYKERMQNHDYSEEDAMIQRVEALEKKWEEITQGI